MGGELFCWGGGGAAGVMALCRGCDPRVCVCVGRGLATMPMQNSQVYFYPYIYAQATESP